MPVIAMNYIDVDAKGVARIIGSRSKVMQIIMDKLAYGWSAEEIQEQYPHLTLAQIYAAFAYYYDHKAEIDAQIEQYHRVVEEYRAQAGPSPLVEKLRALGKLP